MASILERIKRRGNSAAEARQIISQFTGQMEPPRIEIEGTNFWFRASPQLRSGAVVIATPSELQKHIKAGNWMRIRVSEEQRKDLRLEISSARHGGSANMALATGKITVLCKLPGAALQHSMRGADRLNTGNYRDLVLDISSPAGSCPVINLSKTGAKVRLAKEKLKEHFPLGKYLQNGAARLGEKAKVSLLDIIPRCHYEDAVGLEMIVNPQGNSRKILEMFLEHVQRKELDLLAARNETAPAGQPGNRPSTD